VMRNKICVEKKRLVLVSRGGSAAKVGKVAWIEGRGEVGWSSDK